ncbi:MAG: 3-deoxy-D-manno-octulosonic acid transferase [Saprospiraceae bacterium]|nr:3-deoxy-D-manno-octulosonic acid transferase [Saprospiraceae bacterium]
MIAYNIIIRIYGALIWLAQPFSSKAKNWISGRANIWQKITDYAVENKNIVWIHCSSLGEFEQGRPLIEALKNKSPKDDIILTFFSPSGYEIRKNYALADRIFYLPLDTRRNARRFIKQINPSLVIFVKYDFWFNYLSELNAQNIPFVFISAVFRKDHFLFKWWAKPFLKILQEAREIFVQDQISSDLLTKNNCTSIVAGDTRVDRVIQLQKNLKKYEQLGKIRGGRRTIIFGSVWSEDMAIIKNWMQNKLAHSDDFVLIAPHDVSEKMINRIGATLNLKIIRFSQIKKVREEPQIIIVDTIGDLAHLYALADLAYIGGGFGKGIHSILEPAAARLPVIFGPNHEKFKEAQDLIDLHAAISVRTSFDFDQAIAHFSTAINRDLAREGLEKFLNKHRGATSKIVHYLAQSKLIS